MLLSKATSVMRACILCMAGPGNGTYYPGITSVMLYRVNNWKSWIAETSCTSSFEFVATKTDFLNQHWCLSTNCSNVLNSTNILISSFSNVIAFWWIESPWQSNKMGFKSTLSLLSTRHSTFKHSTNCPLDDFYDSELSWQCKGVNGCASSGKVRFTLNPPIH